MSTINVLDEANSEIISLSEIKNFLRIDFDDDNDLLIRLLKSALKICELYISQTLNPKVYQLSLYKIGREINLLYPPVIDVLSINIVNKNNDCLEYKNYMFDKISNKITLNNIPFDFYRIDIVYKAGYTLVPDDLKQAILFHISKMYDDKTGYSPIPKASLNIYKNYKTIRI